MLTMLKPNYQTVTKNVMIYKGDCLEILPQLIQAGITVPTIFADPPYFISNNGITCKSGKMSKVNKGDWDKSKGLILNHNFNYQWLKLCKDILKPDGTIFISGTHHNIYSIGFALQQLEYKIINHITWVKPNPPPNLACKCITHSTEQIIWAAKSDKSKYTFNYADLKLDNNNKQLKDVWEATSATMKEKKHGKHPTQKPLNILNKIIQTATLPKEIILDPFNGSGTTGVAAILQDRNYIGIEQNQEYIDLSINRIQDAIQDNLLNKLTIFDIGA